MKSVCHVLIVLIFILNIIPLFNCAVKEKKEIYFRCKGNKVEKITQNQLKLKSGKVSSTKNKLNLKSNNVQDMSSLLQMGIRNTINTFNFNSKGDAPIYFEKLFKFVDEDLATQGVTFKAILPENFLSLRMLYDTAQEFNESFTSSSLIEIQDIKTEKSTNIFFTSDYKYVVKKISKKRQDILSSMLFDSFSHFCTYPNSLLPKYSGLYYIKQKSIEYYFVIIRNIYPYHENDNMIAQYFLNGAYRTALKSNKSQNIELQFLDNNFIEQYPNGLPVPSQKQKSLVKILENDTKLLAKLNIIDYSLVLITCQSYTSVNEVKGNSIKIFDSNTPNKSIKINDKHEEIFVYYGIIDTLYSYDLKKRIQNVIKCTSNDTVKDPMKYQKRFMQFITSKVFKSD